MPAAERNEKGRKKEEAEATRVSVFLFRVLSFLSAQLLFRFFLSGKRTLAASWHRGPGDGATAVGCASHTISLCEQPKEMEPRNTRNMRKGPAAGLSGKGVTDSSGTGLVSSDGRRKERTDPESAALRASAATRRGGGSLPRWSHQHKGCCAHPEASVSLASQARSAAARRGWRPKAKNVSGMSGSDLHSALRSRNLSRLPGGFRSAGVSGHTSTRRPAAFSLVSPPAPGYNPIQNRA